MAINIKNSIENIVLIVVVMLCLGVYTKLFLEPIMKNTVKAAIEKETTAITQTVSQEIDNKFKVYKGGQVDANVSPVADPTQRNEITTSNEVSHENCVDVSKLSESRRNRIKRWLKD